jgi:DNA-binding winged helix-turn-helix (wHTH) protein
MLAAHVSRASLAVALHASTQEVVVVDVILPADLAALPAAAGDDRSVIALLPAALASVPGSDGCERLVKPVSVPELLARVRAHLAAGRHRAGGAGRGPLVLDPGRRRVWIGRRVVALSEREYWLLSCLLEAAGATVSRQRLLADVWGYHHQPRSNALEVCALRLRRKLAPDASIEAVRCVGYRLVQRPAELRAAAPAGAPTLTRAGTFG